MNFRRAFIPADRSIHPLSALAAWANPRNACGLVLPALALLAGLAVSSFTAAQLPNFLSSEAQAPNAVSIDESTAVTPVLDTQTALSPSRQATPCWGKICLMAVLVASNLPVLTLTIASP